MGAVGEKHTLWLLVGAVGLALLLLGLRSPAPPRRRSCTCPASSQTRTGPTIWPPWMLILTAPPTLLSYPAFTSPTSGMRFTTQDGMRVAPAGTTRTGPAAG